MWLISIENVKILIQNPWSYPYLAEVQKIIGLEHRYCYALTIRFVENCKAWIRECQMVCFMQQNEPRNRVIICKISLLCLALPESQASSLKFAFSQVKKILCLNLKTGWTIFQMIFMFCFYTYWFHASPLLVCFRKLTTILCTQLLFRVPLT